MVVGELFEAAPYLLQRSLTARDAERDVPQAGHLHRLLALVRVALVHVAVVRVAVVCVAVVRVPGRDARQGAFLTDRARGADAPGGATIAGRGRPRAHSSHDGLLYAMVVRNVSLRQS